jgi:hypothetical protein
MYRISRDGHEPIIDVEQVEAIDPAIRSSDPGRNHVDEISADPRPSRHISRRWGVGIRRADGSVEIEPDPWPERHGGPDSAPRSNKARRQPWYDLDIGNAKRLNMRLPVITTGALLAIALPVLSDWTSTGQRARPVASCSAGR